jgi:anti-sigma-K factor RskA
MTDHLEFDELEVMAAGLALGLLHGNERDEALRRQLADPDFAGRVSSWQNVGDRWLEAVEPVEPSAGILASIEGRLDERATNKPLLHAANDDSRMRVWRTWAISATAACAMLAVGLGFTAFRTSPGDTSVVTRQPVNVAQIKDAKGAPLLSAVYNPGSGMLSLRLADLQQPAFGPELWIIPDDDVPRSLGLIESDQFSVILSPELRAFLQDGVTLAITIEPREGAPHDAPTGDIMGTAVLQEIPAAKIS